MKTLVRRLRDEPSVEVARLVLGCTVFLEDGRHWASGGAAEAFVMFSRLVGAGVLRWFTSSNQERWRQLGDRDVPDFVSALRLPGPGSPLRHLLLAEAADDPALPSFVFRYRETDDGRFARKGYIQMFVPPQFPAAALAHAVQSLSAMGPFACGLAGPTATWRRGLPRTAFGGMRAWSRRYLGFEPIEADHASVAACDGLVGTGWITLIGVGMVEALEIDADALAARAWRPGTSVSRGPFGLLVRATDEPDLGDLNRLRVPSQLMEVARVLGPYLAPDLAPFPETFGDAEVFDDWRHRLAEPERWAR